ncbi:MAG: hypothetical protein DHS20C15_07550 [Planctomycetota bacterium]|nr:MAG: hypothetical protein DHS20C15_07550 [Planctomycetota bacterium]
MIVTKLFRVLTALSLLLAGCGPAPADPEGLPGVPPGEAEWFWRDVLSSPFPGEEAPLTEIFEGSALEVVDALVDLGNERHPAALSTLMAALADEREGVALVAAEQLGRLGDRRAIPRLIKGLGPYPVDYDPSLHKRAAQGTALARLGHPAGVPFLLDVLAEGTDLELARNTLPWGATTRMVFAQELALPGIQALAGRDFDFEPNASVPDRTSAVAAMQAWWQAERARLWQKLRRFDEPGLAARIRLLVKHLNAYQLRQIDGARHTLSQLGPPVLPFLETALAEGDAYQRLHTLQVMTRLAGRSDVKLDKRLAVLAGKVLLDSPDAGEAAMAAAVCGAAGVADPLLVAARRRDDPELRVAIVDALGVSRHPEALAALASDRWPDAGPDLQVALSLARLRLDPSAPADAFLDMLTDAGPEFAYPAMQRLSTWSPADPTIDPLAPASERRAERERLAQLIAELRG